MKTNPMIKAMKLLKDAEHNSIREEGMDIMIDMLCDYEEKNFLKMSEKEQKEWVKKYIPEYNSEGSIPQDKPADKPEKILITLYYLKKAYLMAENLLGSWFLKEKISDSGLAEFDKDITLEELHEKIKALKEYLLNFIPEKNYEEWQFSDYDLFTDKYYHRKFWNEIANPAFIEEVIEIVMRKEDLKDEGKYELDLYDFAGYIIYFDTEEQASDFMKKYGVDTATLYEDGYEVWSV